MERTPQEPRQETDERVARSQKSRTEVFNGYPERFPVDTAHADWDTPYPDYEPAYFVHPRVLEMDISKNPNGYAEPEDISLVDHEFTSYEGPVSLDESGRPRNPYTRTGIEGRGRLGKWGANFAADPIVTRVNPQSEKIELLLITRKDSGEWALPGGMVDEGEAVTKTLSRELKEETGLSLNFNQGARTIYRGYVDDPRNTDNAWMETTAAHLHIDHPKYAEAFELQAGDDATSVRWVHLTPEVMENLYANHAELVWSALDRQISELKINYEYWVAYDIADLGSGHWTDPRPSVQEADDEIDRSLTGLKALSSLITAEPKLNGSATIYTRHDLIVTRKSADNDKEVDNGQ